MGDRYHELKLESLDLAAFQQVLDFVELSLEPEVLENFNNIFDPARATARRTSAEQSDLALLKKWIEPTMLWLGYDWPG